MKITSISVFQTDPEIENWMLLRLETDEQIVGWGEISSAPLLRDYVAAQAHNSRDLLKGCDPCDIEGCMAKIHTWSSPYLMDNLLFSTVRSGINQALWDIQARQQEIALYQLLGGVRDEIPLYANINRAIRKSNSVAQMLTNVTDAIHDGFHGVKIAPFLAITAEDSGSRDTCRQIEAGIQKIRSVTRIVGDRQLAIDCHNRFNGETAEIMLSLLDKENIHPFYIEDIVPYHNSYHRALQKMNGLYPNTWAAGETVCSLEQLNDLIFTGLYRIFNPDVKFIGGVSEMLKAIHMVESRNDRIMLHNPTGPVSTAFSAHLMACTQNMPLLEYPFGNFEARNALLTETEPVKNGLYHLPQRPGIGVSISESFLRNYCKIFMDGSWKRM
jgi:galactonate dehydratase